MAWIKKKKKSSYVPGRKRGERDQEIQKIYNTKAWRKLREAHLFQHPLCENCLEKGIINDGSMNGGTPGDLEVHHKRPISDGVDIEEMKTIAYDPWNLKTLCQKCHTEEHKRLRRKNRPDKKG